MAVVKYTAVTNIEPVVTNELIPANIEVDPILGNAYIEDKNAAKQVEAVLDELEEKAANVILDAPEVVEVKNDNIYTKKIILDESVEEFDLATNKPSRVTDDDAYDTYWDMDMFDFVYELVSLTDARRKPIDPLGRPHARFAVTGRDRYAGLTAEQKKIEQEQEKQMEKDFGSVERAMLGSPQVAAGDDYLDVYAHNEFRFNDLIAICDKYGFKTEGPKETFKKKRNKFMMTSRDEWLTYEYTFRIYVPCDSNGIALRIEDYFEPKGLQLEDVMNPEFCKHYRKIQKTIEKEKAELIAKKEKEQLKAKAKQEADFLAAKNVEDVENIYKKYYDKAAWSNDPIEDFIKDMFAELDAANLKYNKSDLKKRFTADFEDDFEDDIEEGLVSGGIMGAAKDLINKISN